MEKLGTLAFDVYDVSVSPNEGEDVLCVYANEMVDGTTRFTFDVMRFMDGGYYVFEEAYWKWVRQPEPYLWMRLPGKATLYAIKKQEGFWRKPLK